MKRAKASINRLSINRSRHFSGRLVLLGAGKMGCAPCSTAGWRAGLIRASSRVIEPQPAPTDLRR